MQYDRSLNRFSAINLLADTLPNDRTSDDPKSLSGNNCFLLELTRLLLTQISERFLTSKVSPALSALNLRLYMKVDRTNYCSTVLAIRPRT